MASSTSTGTSANQESFSPTISADGRYVAFQTSSSNLVTGDTNGTFDIFVKDMSTLAIKRVSVSSSGAQASGSSSDPKISADGRYIAFTSASSNLVSGDTNGRRDVFVHDQFYGTTVRVSLSSSGAQANADSGRSFEGFGLSISARGRYVVYLSSATNLVSGDTNSAPDIFVTDTIAGITKRVSVSSAGEQANNHSSQSVISPDGRSVAFFSNATNLVAGDTNGIGDVFVHELGTADLAVALEQTFGDCEEALHAVNASDCESEVSGPSGAYVTSVTDASLPGIGIPFTFTRSYTSADTLKEALGQGWLHNYSAALISQINGDQVLRGETGQRVTFTRKPDGTYAPATGARSTLTSITGGHELVRHDRVTYRFDLTGKLTEIRDRNGQGLTLSYDLLGRIQQVTDSVGRVITFTHDVEGRLTGIALPDSRNLTFGYLSGRLTSVLDLRGGTTSYSYDSNGRLSQIVDQRGNAIVRNTYGSDGRVIEQFNALANKTTFSWDPATRTLTRTDPRGGQWRDVYSGNVLAKQVDPLGNTVSYEYDADLNVIRRTDARGNTTVMSYDSRGNLLSRMAPPPLSYQETFTYDSSNNLLTSIDGRSKITTFEYDAAGNLVKKTQPGGVVTIYERDPAGTGLLKSETDPRGKTTTFEYVQGNRTKVTTPVGNATTMTYDSSGRMTSRVDPRGNVAGATPGDYRTTFSYDAADHLISETTPLGHTTSYGYDPVGNRASVTDAQSRTTGFTYDAVNRLTAVTAPDNTTTSYGYDDSGNLVSQTDAKNRVTTYGYDAANRRTSLTSPIGQLWTYGYDGDGNRTKIVDAAGNSTATQGDGTTTFGYDALNRLTSIDYSDATPDVSFGYDQNGNRTSMADGAGTETYVYDALNRLTSVTRGGGSFSYAYDAASHVTQRTYPDGTVVDYTFDDDGRLASAASGGATMSYAYDAAGNLTQTMLPASNGHVETRTYDRSGRLVDVGSIKSGTTLSSHAYTLDKVGNPTRVDSDSGTTTYNYDSLDRLTEACFAVSCPGPSDPFIRYGYDEVGNRTTETRPAGTTSYSYNAADQVTSSTGTGGTTNYGYDQNGNETSVGAWTFTYDLANRMKTAADGQTSVTYSYDGDGKRLQTSTGDLASQKTNYLWDRNGSLPLLVLERDGDNALVRRYVYGSDLISMTTGGADYYFHYDRLGSVTNLTSASGAKQWTYTYEPFGAIKTETHDDPNAPANLMRFTGELFDTQTGLYHLRARQYDSITGRFTQTDPVPSPITDPYVAVYVYVNNRPTVLTDPSGLTPWWRLLFDEEHKHFTVRRGRPALHWGEGGKPSQHRIEWSKRYRWHYNPPEGGTLPFERASGEPPRERCSMLAGLLRR